MSATVTALPRRRPGRLAAAQPRLAGVTVARARGAWVEDETGRAFLDLTSGVATLNLGHGHPRVLAAARAQMDLLMHCGGAFDHPPAAELAGRLGQIAPPGLDEVLFATTGSEANELALKVARRVTGRPGVIAFRGGFHGRTTGAMACSTSRAGMRGALGAGIAVAPFPRPAAWAGDDGAAARAALAELDELHRHDLAPGDTAAYLVEPVQGHGGCNPAGRRFLQGLRERADRHGIQLVFDEVQTGMGRTGHWFAAQTYGVRPDLMTLAKALGAGFPLSAVLGGEGPMRALPSGHHGSTFGGGPLACAAAVAAIDVVEDEGLLARARALARRARARLDTLAARCPHVAEVRGEGLIIGIALTDPAGGAGAGRIAEDACAAARDAGVLVIRSGPDGDVLRLLPPLTLTDDELERGLDAVIGALDGQAARVA